MVIINWIPLGVSGLLVGQKQFEDVASESGKLQRTFVATHVFSSYWTVIIPILCFFFPSSLLLLLLCLAAAAKTNRLHSSEKILDRCPAVRLIQQHSLSFKYCFSFSAFFFLVSSGSSCKLNILSRPHLIINKCPSMLL